MREELNNFEYEYRNNGARKTLFLLHGTGGSKHDFLFLDKLLENKFNLVGLKGNVDENGMARFFRRLTEGVFDQESIRTEAAKFKAFIEEWMIVHKVSADALAFLGYSNGANFLLASLFLYPDLFRSLILLHPMLPFSIENGSLDLSQHKIFVSMGAHDPLVAPEMQREVVETLSECGAHLSVREYPAGHEISAEEIEDIIESLKEIHKAV